MSTASPKLVVARPLSVTFRTELSHIAWPQRDSEEVVPGEG